MTQGHPLFQVIIPLEEACYKLILGNLLGLILSGNSSLLSFDSDSSHLHLGVRSSGNDVCQRLSLSGR